MPGIAEKTVISAPDLQVVTLVPRHGRPANDVASMGSLCRFAALYIAVIRALAGCATLAEPVLLHVSHTSSICLSPLILYLKHTRLLLKRARTSSGPDCTHLS
jgi:hypothetical protein